MRGKLGMSRKCGRKPIKRTPKSRLLSEHNPLYLEMYIKEYLGFIADLYGCSKERVSDMIEAGLSPETTKNRNYQGYRQVVWRRHCLRT